MKNIYLLYGDERFLIKQEKDNLINQTIKNNIEYKVSTYDMVTTHPDEIFNDLITASLFEDKKVIICDNAFFLTSFKTKPSFDSDLFIKRLSAIDNEKILILTVDGKLDERKKIVKYLREKAIVKELNKLKDNDLYIYAKQLFNSFNYKIDNQALNLLINQINDNLGLLYQESYKLMTYKIDDLVISYQDVKDLVSKPIIDLLFELIDAVIKRDIKEIFKLYQKLLLINEEPVKIIVTLANQFRLIYQTKILKKQGLNNQAIALQLGIHPYRIKLAANMNFKEPILLTYLEKLADLDINIKSGKINKYLGLELFFLQL